jgi:hypothetical protein
VIAKSLSKRLWEVSPFTPEHGAPIEPKPGATRFHTNRLIDIVVNVACSDCNSKFFNALQSPCDGFLRSALAGELSTLDSDLKKALASWLYKTALLVPLALSPRADWPQYLIDECKAFYVRRRPPVGTRVWIGRYDLRDSIARTLTDHSRRSALSLNVVSTPWKARCYAFRAFRPAAGVAFGGPLLGASDRQVRSSVAAVRCPPPPGVHRRLCATAQKCLEHDD